MKFRNVISGPIFCADAPDVVIETADAAGIDVRLSISGFVWQFALSPVAEQSGYVATIKTRDILEALIEPSSIGSVGVSGVPVVEISAGADTESSISMSFQALYGSAAGKTPADMARHWLTWRDQISATYFGCRERLTFFAGLDLLGWKSGSYTVAVKIYTPSGIVQATLASGTIPSQVSYISVDASPASVLAVGEVSSLLAYDLSFSLSGTAADDTAATVESYPLRLVLGAADPRAKEFIYINSLGVEDRVTACGIRKDGLEGGSSKFVNGGVEREHGNDAQEQFEVYSGHLATARSVEQWMEFLKSSERHLYNAGLKGIVIDDYDTEVQEGELCSVSFTYRLSERIKGFHHDDSESIGEYDPTQKYGALVVGDVPDAANPPAEDLFFLKTRLDEFPLVSLSEDYLLLVQSPVSYHWGAASLGSIKNWIQKTIDHNGISLAAVWASLSKTVPDTYANELISEDHIPVLPQSKVTGLQDALSSLRSSYAGISALIPQAATADNQLADKEFVNSSIATATATFRGTFATLEALKATPADRNDYAFWEHKDADGNNCYDKYTYDGSAWKFEYRLNNSSFTAAQWGAINSGITGSLVTKLSGISDWALAASKPSYTTAEVTEKTNLYFTDARAKDALSGHTGDATIHITAAERKAWNAKWDWNEATVKAVKVNAAGSADKLANSRKLWGNAFNGTADVDGDITLGSGKRIYFGSTSYYIELVNGNIHTNVGLYSDKFISARGADPDAGGGSGASLPVVWASLQGNTDDYKDKTIHQAHIPTLPVSRIDGLATALAGKQPAITADSKLDYSLLKNTPTIGNGTITIKQGTNSQTFSTNQGDNKTITLTDTTYESKTAASGGTALSLVTTGEKYTWNNKWDYNAATIASVKVNNAVAADKAPWGGITGKPTTLLGYGITDALSLNGGTLNGWLIINASTLPISELTANTTTPDTTWNRAQNVNLLLRSENNAMTISIGGQVNERKGIIQVGHYATTYANALGDLYLNKSGGKVYIGEKLAYHEGNANKSDVDWNAANLTAEKRVRIKNANVIAFLSTDAMPKERLLGPMSSYDYDLAWHNGAQWNKVYHSGNFIDGTNYISPKTTLGGYGIEDWIVKTSTDSPDTLKTAGNYKVAIAGTSGNGYDFKYGQVLVLCATTDSNTIAQIAAPYDNNNLYFRSGTVSNFTDANHPWRTIYTSGNANKSDVNWTCSTMSSMAIGSPYSDVFDANNPDKWLNSNYGSANKDYSNMPSGWEYGTVLTIGQQNRRGINGDLNAQFVWDVQHGKDANNPGRLWWRTKNSVNGWKNWQEIYHSGNCNNSTTDWVCNGLRAAAEVNTQRIEFASVSSSAGHGGFIDFHFNGNTEDYTSRIIEDAKGRLSLRSSIVRVGTASSTTLALARPSFNYIWTDVAGGTLVLGTTDGGVTSSSNSAIFIKGKKVYIGGTETGNNALNVLGVAHATTGIYTDGYISARKQDTSSDIRLKTDFRPLDGALEYIRGTHFTRFRWKDGSGESVGIIAQEEQSREYGFLVRSHGEIGHLTYDYAASTALLGAALQEEDDKVEALKRRVKELENELNKLKQSNYANR